MSTCPRCGDAIESENDVKYVGVKDGSVLFEDEMEYEEIGPLCPYCRYDLEEWLRGETFEEIEIRLSVQK